MELLVVLASRPGQVVSRQELLSAVWPGVIVGDEALSQVVTKLRKALGDDARLPTYIETISKRGYRLIAPVQPSEAGLAIETPVPARGRSQLPRRVATVGILVVLLIAGAYLLQTTQQQTALPESRAGADVNRPARLPTVTVLPSIP